jgi:predicted nucleic acid-binding protein
MSLYVVDSSVAIKWYVPEVHDAEAQRLRAGGAILHAPTSSTWKWRPSSGRRSVEAF